MASVLRAFEGLDDAAAPILLEIARESAEAVRSDARARLARQTSGTGLTGDAITVDKIEGGYVVTTGSMGSRPQNLPIWLEFGTKYMTARPYFRAAGVLEEPTYVRRVAEGLQAAIDSMGRG